MEFCPNVAPVKCEAAHLFTKMKDGTYQKATNARIVVSLIWWIKNHAYNPTSMWFYMCALVSIIQFFSSATHKECSAGQYSSDYQNTPMNKVCMHIDIFNTCTCIYIYISSYLCLLTMKWLKWLLRKWINIINFDVYIVCIYELH